METAYINSFDFSKNSPARRVLRRGELPGTIWAKIHGKGKNVILYHYTIAVFLCILLACATCFSTYVVTRRNVFLSASIFFLAYFFDVSLVFRTTYAPSRGGPDLFAIHSPVESVLIGALLVFCTWLTFCLYVGKTSYLATLSLIHI